ncbi:MAG: glutamine--fructose-6-phosphate transaminase (isomerizing) [Actinobacteria bacterium]|nr:glutamine--fructose-6-phosphate transaminase (isomerizing) [Actinomycetota bacterium]
MCGIVAYTGKKDNIKEILIEGLKKLEYRGYDSAGIAVCTDTQIKVSKKKGFIKDLEKELSQENFRSTTGIGHTRWATHGEPSDINSHPHTDCTEKFAVVHNGIIENYKELREELESRGHVFKSKTDTEVIVHLIEENFDGDLLNAVLKSVKKLKGSFAIAVVSAYEPETVVGARQDSPLIAGLGEGENFLASDIPAVLKHTRKILVLEDGEAIKITPGSAEVYDFDGRLRHKEVLQVTWDAEAAEKSGYEDFMLKEIFEQPDTIRNTLRGRIKQDGFIDLSSEIKIGKNILKKLERIIIVACGTSYYAGLVGKNAIELFAQIPVEVEISSEFRYRPILAEGNVLVIAITQSGETADTLVSMRMAKKVGFPVLAIPNVVGSTAAREADGVLYTHAGPEIGVAATKTMTAQMVALYLFALYLAQLRNRIGSEREKKFIDELKRLPELVEMILSRKEHIKALAEKYAGFDNFLFLGRTHGLPAAYEGALKLKEITYIHAEGYPAGEMKHGPIALIDENFPSVFIATAGEVYEKIISNIEEIKARKGKVIAVATDGDTRIKELVDDVIYVPWTFEVYTPLVTVVPLQLFTYYIGKIRNLNVDQPRNLAKSVTVE